MPGRRKHLTVEINLAPGTYDYTASMGGIGSVTRSVDVVAGKVTSLAFMDNPDQYKTPASAGALLYFQGDVTRPGPVVSMDVRDQVTLYLI
jgi:hypothetical protein